MPCSLRAGRLLCLCNVCSHCIVVYCFDRSCWHRGWWKRPCAGFLFICSVCLDICLGKDERMALLRNCASGFVPLLVLLVHVFRGGGGARGSFRLYNAPLLCRCDLRFIWPIISYLSLFLDYQFGAIQSDSFLLLATDWATAAFTSVQSWFYMLGTSSLTFSLAASALCCNFMLSTKIK